MGVIAEGDQGDPLSARVDVKVRREIINEAYDVTEVEVVDTARRVGEKHNIRLTAAT